jgi:hypothetical protein
MVDSFIDIAIWLTITILVFNVFAIWVNTTTTNENLMIPGVNNWSSFNGNTFDTNTENTISDTSSEVSQTKQAQLLGYEGNILEMLYDLLLMWQQVLVAVIPPQAAIIGTMISIIIGVIEGAGILALLIRLATAIGALIPFT